MMNTTTILHRQHRQHGSALLLALLLGAVLSGCSMFTSQPEVPRTDPLLALQGDIDAVRRENEQMRAFQGSQAEKVKTLEQQLAKEREAHEQYREMMATNFELLEQSVAQTMSTMDTPRAQQTAMAVSIPAPVTGPVPTDMPMLSAQEARTADLSAQQSAANARAATMAERNAASMNARQPIAAPSATAMPRSNTAAPRSSSAPMANASAKPSSAGAMAAAAFVPVAAQSDRPFSDPDLIPPEQPRLLQAHPEAKALYERGFNLFAHKNYDEAIEVYTGFLERFPDDIYSDNAQFWVGESQLRSKRLPAAELAFRQVLRDYEHRSTLEGYKTPDAILRIGQIAAANGDVKRAHYYFSNAAERFPDSSAGRKAQQELESLRLNTADASLSTPRS